MPLTRHAPGSSGASVGPHCSVTTSPGGSFWLPGCHPCTSPQIGLPRMPGWWALNPTVLLHSPTPGSWLSPQQQTPGRPGMVARTAGPILALRPGAHRVPNSRHLAQGTCICTGTFAPVLTGAALALTEAGPSHAGQGRPQGPGGKVPTDPVPLRRAPPGAGEAGFRPLRCPLPPQVSGVQPCRGARSSAWPSPAPSSSSQRC